MRFVDGFREQNAVEVTSLKRKEGAENKETGVFS